MPNSRMVTCDCGTCRKCKARQRTREWLSDPVNQEKKRAYDRERRKIRSADPLRSEHDRTVSREYQRTRRQDPAYRQKQVEAQRKFQYGVMPGEVERMRAAQNGRCYMPTCQVEFAGRGKRKLCVDHCHSTGRVRKLLCASCNFKLGFYETNVNRHAEFAEYVAEHSSQKQADELAANLTVSRGSTEPDPGTSA